MKNFIFTLLCLAFMVVSSKVKANNLTITNVSLTGATATTIQVQYNMFWDNSWRDARGWDAAWVFIKYSTDNGSTWAHATMSTSGHVAGTASPTPTIQIPQDNLGAFIYRSTTGNGNYSITGQELQWNFAVNGLNQSQASSSTVRVFGMEMVYIPQGPYYLGDGVNNTATAAPSPNAYRQVSTGNAAAYVGSGMSDPIQDPIGLANFRIDGLNGIDMNNDGVVGAWPTDAPDFPNGYKALYCMKYKITQGQYCDFLNTLTYAQQTARVGNATNTVGASAWNGATTVLPAHRYNIFVQTAGTSPSVPRVYTATRPDRNCNFLNWPDGCAYADWAGLRPYTDMEREKIGRGHLPPVQGQFSNGTISNSNLTAISAGAENGLETASSSANNYYNIFTSATISGGDGSFNRGPVRAGIFAETGTTRTTSGSTFYGVMDFSGSLIEWTVSFAGLAGRSFTGLHGNGGLNANGQADVDFWPGINGNATYTTANAAYAGTTGVTSGAGAVFTEITDASSATAPVDPWIGTSNPSYAPWRLSLRFPISLINLTPGTTSTTCTSGCPGTSSSSQCGCSSSTNNGPAWYVTNGRHTQYAFRYQLVGFRAVKSNL